MLREVPVCGRWKVGNILSTEERCTIVWHEMLSSLYQKMFRIWWDKSQISHTCVEKDATGSSFPKGGPGQVYGGEHIIVFRVSPKKRELKILRKKDREKEDFNTLQAAVRAHKWGMSDTFASASDILMMLWNCNLIEADTISLCLSFFCLRMTWKTESFFIDIFSTFRNTDMWPFSSEVRTKALAVFFSERCNERAKS